MKKIIISIILVSQLGWTFNPGFFAGNKNCSSDISRPMTVEVCGFSGLIMVVHSNFINSLTKVIELSCLIPQLPNKGKKDENGTTKTEQQNPLYFCNQLLNLSGKNFKVVDSRLGHLGMTIYSGQSFLLEQESRLMFLCGLCIGMMFLLYLHKLKFCVYSPRGGVTGILILSRTAGLLHTSSNWMGNVPHVAN